MRIPITKSLGFFFLVLSLAGCSGSSPNWYYQHPRGLDPAQQERDLSDCKYYASITDFRAFNSEKPVNVQEFDAPVRECMAKRGWNFIEVKQKTD